MSVVYLWFDIPYASKAHQCSFAKEVCGRAVSPVSLSPNRQDYTWVLANSNLSKGERVSKLFYYLLALGPLQYSAQ